jgi:hypothetical protein
VRRQRVLVDGREMELPSSLIASRGSEDHRVGDAGERRTRVGSVQGGPLEVVATLETTWLGGGALDTGEDGPDLWTNTARVSVEKPTPLFGRLAAAVGTTRWTYAFSGRNSLVAGTDRPFGSAQRLSLSLSDFQPVHEAWALVGAFGATWAAEDGADLADGFTWTFTGGVGHRISPSLDVGVGVILGHGFGESGLDVLAGPQFSWRPRPDWRVRLDGTTLDVAWQPSPSWELSAGGGLDGHRFRLDDRGPGAGYIVAESNFPLWMQARYRGLADLDLTLRLGLDVRREFTIEDASGSTLRTVGSDPSPYARLRLIWRL